MAKQVDPHGLRTILVLTKLDLMTDGTDASCALTGQILDYKLGIVGVVNRNQKEIEEKKSIERSLQDEENFLMKKYPQLAKKNGTEYLAKTLQRLLKKHIDKCLPSLLTEIAEFILKTKKELESYGDVPKDKRLTLNQAIEEFCTEFKRNICRSNSGVIRRVLEEQIQKETSKINPEKDLDNETIRSYLNKYEGIESFRHIPMNAFKVLAKDQIRRLEEPALRYGETCHAEIMELMHQSLDECDKVRRFNFLRTTIGQETTNLINDFHEDAQKALRKYVEYQDLLKLWKPEIKTLIENLSERNDGLALLYSDKNHFQVTPEESVRNLRKLVAEYYKLVLDEFNGLCPQIIADEMLKRLEKNLQCELSTKLLSDDTTIALLIEENFDISGKREAARQRLAKYRDAETIINRMQKLQV